MSRFAEKSGNVALKIIKSYNTHYITSRSGVAFIDLLRQLGANYGIILFL